MMIADNTGAILLNTGEHSPAQSTKGLIDAVVSGNKVRDTLGLSPAGEPALMLGFPLYSRGKSVGVAIYYQHLRNIVGLLASGEGESVVLLDSDAKRIYASQQDIADRGDWNVFSRNEPDWNQVMVGKEHFTAVSLPLTSEAGELLGNLLLLRNNSEVYNRHSQIATTQIVVSIFTLVVVIGVLYLVVKSAFRPLDKAVVAMSQIAAGNLTENITCDSKNEISKMLGGMQEMQHNLREMIESILGSSRKLNQMAAEASEITEATSAGALQQKAETEVFATAMTELAATAESVSENAGEAADAAREADDQAHRGKSVVESVTKAIQSLATEVKAGAQATQTLQKNSEEIEQILSVIKAVAEQTNLLALNAAIEAARAGEQGRGFAVVADEVRNLASRTQNSTSEINALIERLQTGTQSVVKVMEVSQRRADESVSRVQEAGSALNAITDSIGRISEMNTKIAVAAREQGSVVSDINKNIVNMANVAEKTAQDSARSASSNNQVSSLSNELQSMVTRFKV
jgi:methyl-accepting chemotaxis protein